MLPFRSVSSIGRTSGPNPHDTGSNPVPGTIYGAVGKLVLSRHSFKVEITGSSPVGATKNEIAAILVKLVFP